MGNNTLKDNKSLSKLSKNQLKDNSTFGNINNENLGSIDNGLMQCKFCGRKFAFDRILKHQNICRNVKHKPNSIEQNVKLRDDKDEYGNKIKDDK